MTKHLSPFAPMPLVTIGMPVFDCADHLRDALDSICAQTYPNLEIIISDNGSTDETPAICREYAARDPRIRYIREAENRGAVWNFNRLLPLAGGTYFKWAAGDDVCDPDFVARCVAVLEEDPTVVGCHSRTGSIDGSGRQIDGATDPTRASRRHDAADPHDRFRDVLLTQAYSARSFGVFRTRDLSDCAPLLAVYGSEKVLMAELALKGRFHDIDDTLFFERHDDTAPPRPATHAAQAAFVGAARTGTPLSARLRLLEGYRLAIARSGLALGERIRCRGGLLGYLFQVRKWRRVLRGLADRPTANTPPANGTRHRTRSREAVAEGSGVR